jgi:hypothetical protein
MVQCRSCRGTWNLLWMSRTRFRHDAGDAASEFKPRSRSPCNRRPRSRPYGTGTVVCRQRRYGLINEYSPRLSLKSALRLLLNPGRTPKARSRIICAPQVAARLAAAAPESQVDAASSRSVSSKANSERWESRHLLARDSGSNTHVFAGVPKDDAHDRARLRGKGW